MSDAEQQEVLPPPPTEGQQEVELVTNSIWDPTMEGEWLQGVLTGIREVPVEDRVNLIYDFADVRTARALDFGEGEDAFSTGPDFDSGPLSVWASAMLERRITDEHVGSKMTLVYDGRGNRRARIYRVFIS